MNYTVFDVETANARRDSICSIGIVRVEDNQIVYKDSILINPETEFNSIPLLNGTFNLSKETDKNGIAEISDIRTGKVIIRETKTKQDYVHIAGRKLF